jgi:hypothetical protein
MPLPIGTWAANVNGRRCPLAIESVDGSGAVLGHIDAEGLGMLPMTGLWDEVTQRLRFCLSITGGDPTVNSSFALFSCFMFEDSYRMPGVLGGTVYTLVGEVAEISSSGPELLPGARRSTDRPVFGWYAQIGFA